MGRLEGKSAIVTGATSGIGRAQARAFAREGAKVFITGRNEERLNAVLAEIRAEGGKCAGMCAKIESPEDCRAVARETVKTFGTVDILANTAGVFDGGKKSLELTEDEWKYIFDVNVNGVFYMSNAVLPVMTGKKSGVIVNMASISGLTAGPSGVAYIASKHAVVGYTKQLALEYAREGIRVNAIAPGSVLTPLLEGVLAADPSGLERRLELIPSGRLGTPEDIASLSVFLASDESEWIQGAVISIDGGRFAKG